MTRPASTSRKRDLAIATALAAAFNGFVLLVLKGVVSVPEKLLDVLFTICIPGVLLAGQLVKQNLIGLMVGALFFNLLLQIALLYAALRVLGRVLRTFRPPSS